MARAEIAADSTTVPTLGLVDVNGNSTHYLVNEGMAILKSRPNPLVRRVLSFFRYGRQGFDSDIERVRHRQHGRVV